VLGKVLVCVREGVSVFSLLSFRFLLLFSLISGPAALPHDRHATLHAHR
jgi:hypothetical protein